MKKKSSLIIIGGVILVGCAFILRSVKRTTDYLSITRFHELEDDGENERYGA